MTDSDDEMVIVSASAGYLGNTTYHTDPNCPSVKRMDETVEKPLDVLAGAYSECERCGRKPGPTPSESPTTPPTPLDGLPPSAKFVYTVLDYEDELTQPELADATHLPTRTVRYALDRLIGADLVESRPVVGDARRKRYRPVEPVDTCKTQN